MKVLDKGYFSDKLRLKRCSSIFMLATEARLARKSMPKKMKKNSQKKRVTVTQVADRLGLSPTTVSLVLNGRAEKYCIPQITIERVQRQATRMNYHPSAAARQLKGKQSNAVGVLISAAAFVDPRLIQQMEILAARRDMRFIVGHAVGTNKQVKSYLDDFRARGVDGIISIFHSHPDYASTVLPELAHFENVVYYERPDEGQAGVSESPCYVQPDYYEVGRLGVQHLLERGRRRIALLMNDLVFPYAKARHRAYEDTLEASDVKVDKQLVWVMDQQPGMHWSESFDEDRALRAADHLVAAGRADAIVAVNDFYAARLIAALRRRGRRVPDDVAILGCDNLDIGTLIEPQLTTIDLHTTELAQAVVRMFFELLDSGAVPEDRRAAVIEPTLIIRGST
jgi:DNA-binding LacI/PurR family transcriptional regulator